MSRFGGKGRSLIELSKLNFPVPAFLVLDSSELQLDGSELIISRRAKQLLDQFLERSTSNLFAVRSSCSAEDGDQASFAGLFESYLNISGLDLEAHIVKVLKSIDSDRVREYKKSRNSNATLSMSVVVQEMIHGDWSGVAFSRHPTDRSGHLYFEACPGLGHSIVDGRVEALRVSMNRYGETLQLDGPQNLEGEVFSKDQLQRVTVQRDAWPAEIGKEISKCLLELEAEFKTPVDIEWAYKSEKFYLLQCRPITTENSKLRVFTDFNIIESYPGTLSLLSYEFVKKSYERVFNEAIELFGFCSKRKEHVKSVTSSLVELHQGHVYYHLNNYYCVLDNLPGTGHRQSWHGMIGGKVQSWVEVPPVSSWKVHEYLKLATTLCLRIPQWFWVVRSFGKVSNTRIDSMTKEANDLKNYSQLVSCAQKYTKITKGWGWTVLNDLLIMLFTKRVEKLNEASNRKISIQEYLRTGSRLESVRPLESLGRLRDSIGDLDIFIREYGEYFSSLGKIEYIIQQKKPNWASDFKLFMDEFGDRCFEELKLESLSFRQNPQLLLKLLKSFNHREGHLTSQDLSLESKSPKWMSLKLLRKAVQFREELRLHRGLAFGWLRNTLFKAYQSFLSENKFEDFTFTEFLNLTFEEHKRYSNSEMTLEQFIEVGKSRIQNPKTEYPSQFYLCEGESLSDWIESYKVHHVEKSQGDELHGIGASQGLARGRALVVESPTEALNSEKLAEMILVTRTTDPAWVYLMSQCRGLVSEKGSLLSHTAIIGRELGIPTVVSVEGALKSIEDGQLIEVDGGLGTIRFVKEESIHEGMGSQEL